MPHLDTLITGLGGNENIIEIEPCITRLRIEVYDPSLINVQTLRSSGCHGVSNHGSGVQIVIGPQAERVADELSSKLWAHDHGDSDEVI